jgi:UDP-N-acetylmuramate: L-alanyl-gamma-D-glutamyl-meso-diaminopimelate ligase
MIIHILGICGTFMGGLARILSELDHDISGSDVAFYPPMSDQLNDLGINLTHGYAAKDLPSADLYIIGNALSRGNESVEYILENKLNFTSGPAMLGNVLKDKNVLAVSGTHGKTTTAAMLCKIMHDKYKDIGYLVGGVAQDLEGSAKLGKGEYFIIEADEYDSAFFDKRSKFIHYSPNTLIINNIEFDHADIFSDVDEIYKQFHHLVRIIPNNGNIIFHSDDKDVGKLIQMGCWSNLFAIGEESISYNHQENIISADNNHFTVDKLPFFGRHNYQNAVAAMHAAYLNGVDYKSAFNSLQEFGGVKRRLQVVYNKNNKIVYDDFAHHPTAISATIDAVIKDHSGGTLGIIELASNTMKSGHHGKALLESAHKLDYVYWLDRNRVLDHQNAFDDLENLLNVANKDLRECKNILLMTNSDSKKLIDPIAKILDE